MLVLATATAIDMSFEFLLLTRLRMLLDGDMHAAVMLPTRYLCQDFGCGHYAALIGALKIEFF